MIKMNDFMMLEKIFQMIARGMTSSEAAEKTAAIFGVTESEVWRCML